MFLVHLKLNLNAVEATDCFLKRDQRDRPAVMIQSERVKLLLLS